MSDTTAAARAWASGWHRAWTTHDHDLVATLYTQDATFSEGPFRALRRGDAGARDYAAWAFADEDRAEVWFGEPFVAHDERAAVEWWAIVTKDDTEETIAGTSLLEVAADGRVRMQRDYWQVEAGRREPHEAWAR